MTPFVSWEYTSTVTLLICHLRHRNTRRPATRTWRVLIDDRRGTAASAKINSQRQVASERPSSFGAQAIAAASASRLRRCNLATGAAARIADQSPDLLMARPAYTLGHHNRSSVVREELCPLRTWIRGCRRARRSSIRTLQVSGSGSPCVPVTEDDIINSASRLMCTPRHEGRHKRSGVPGPKPV